MMAEQLLPVMLTVFAALVCGCVGQQQQPGKNGVPVDASCSRGKWAERVNAINRACCPQQTAGGHHRILQSHGQEHVRSCGLPTTCPSESCAMKFVEFMAECQTLVKALEAQTHSYNVLFASCSRMVTASGPGDGKGGTKHTCPVHDVCHGAEKDPLGGLMPAHCHTECFKKPLGTETSCRHLTTPQFAAEHRRNIQQNKVMVYGFNRERSTLHALDRLYDDSICYKGKVLTSTTEKYLRCLYPDDTKMEASGFRIRSYIFFGSHYLGSGYSLGHLPSNELEKRLKAVSADRTCGKAATPPPPPPGQVNACVKPGSTKIVAQQTTLPSQCKKLKDLLPKKKVGHGLKCNAVNDAGPWNDFLSCAFRANNWVTYRHGGQGGCGGPTLFAFCENQFAGDQDAITCCSNTRCPWSASLFGAGGGSPYCINDKYAVNICCTPCTCWLSPVGVTPGGRGNMTIVEHYHGRSYPVLLNSDGLPIAAPFKCSSTGLFGNSRVTQLSQWQAQMGDCSHDPMGGR